MKDTLLSALPILVILVALVMLGIVPYTTSASSTSITLSTSSTSTTTSSTSITSSTSTTSTTSSTSTTISTTSTMSSGFYENGLPANAMEALPKNSLFVSNSSIIGISENDTTANIISPIILNYQELNNLTALNQSQMELVRAQFINANILYSFNKSISIPYGDVMQNHTYIKAGSMLHYVAYNTHGIVTYYNVSIAKAQPRLAIKVNGAVVVTPNSTAIIHIPVIRGRTSYNVSLSLSSSLAYGNTADYKYEIKFSNGTTISESINASAIDYSNIFNLPLDQNATITFGMSDNHNYTAVDPALVIVPATIAYYLSVALNNSQTTATSAPFQDMLPVNSLTYNTYEAGNLDNIEFFYANGTIIPSWMEGSTSNTLLNNPTNSVYLSTSTNTIYWLNISKGIPASSTNTIYMGFALTSQNLFNNVDVGEAPQISSTYAGYDDGSNVFLYYNVNPASTAGWTVAGTAGLATLVPAESHYATTNALYANSANGDYLYTSVPSLTSNIIISYDVYTTGLGNMFFLVSSSGAGQMTRLDSRGGTLYSGLATTSSWTSWTAPSAGLDESSSTWYKYDTVVSGTSAYAYIGSASNSIAAYGTATSASAFTVTNNGNYIGLVGDGLGSSYITYWSGIVIRAYPPNGIMPSLTFGPVISTNAPVLTFQYASVDYDITDKITAIATTNGDSVEIITNGNVIAGPAANTVSYTVCDTIPALGNCWTPGSYTITANDITSDTESSAIMTVNKGIPALTLPSSNAVVNTGSNVVVNYGISAVGNQLTASLLVNGATVSSTTTSGTYNLPNANGLYALQVTTAGNGNYTAANSASTICIVPTPSQFPSNILYYAPLCAMNNQATATPAPFQGIINITESRYSSYLSYNGNLANFEIFNAIGAVQPAWIESNQSGKLVTWVNIANGIAANSISPLYIGFASGTYNMLSGSGTAGIGEYPTATSAYGQYDDGLSVFSNYFAGNSLSGWTTAGTAGQTASAPSGSPFGANAFYANGANGDYLYATASSQSANMIIEYYTYTANLDDVFFLVSSSGAGQMGRVGNGGGWYGITSTSSWTSWTAPPDTGEWSNKWLLLSIVVASGSAKMSVSPNPGIYSSEIGQNISNTYSVANDGNYLGLVGDAASGTTVQYWNGMIMRAYPPNGVMPSVSFGSVVAVSCTISLSPNTINFGSLNAGSSIATTNAIADDNTGGANAYMLVYGGNWIGPGSNTFGVSNTTWASSSGVAYSSANELSATAANTLLTVPASGSNTIYFGLNVAGGAPFGSYSQAITIENSC